MTRQAAGGLIGRDRDLGFLREFVRQGAVGGAALALSGDPGMGKTAPPNARPSPQPRRGPSCCA